MGEEVAERVHDADRGFLVFDSHMAMEAEDEVGAGCKLKILNDFVVALVGVDLLHAPVREGVGGAGDEAEAVFFRETDHVAAQVEEVFLCFLDVLADAGAYLDDGLMELRLDALFEPDLALL